MTQKNKWFEEWFDSPYYHILYKHRDVSEAEAFVQRLIDHLDLDPSARVMDLACGKGRHAKIFAENGFETVGVDLSPNSIRAAQTSYASIDHLSFEVHDMREEYSMPNHFDLVVNLFTSFGYFDYLKDNDAVLIAVNKMLKNNGLMVIDYMNAERVVKNLVESETQTIEGIEFHINRRIDDQFVIKRIEFQDKGKSYAFEEKVQLLTELNFRNIMTLAGLKAVELYGSYELEPWSPDSRRTIMIGKKEYGNPHSD